MEFETAEHIDSAYFRGTSALKCGSMLNFVFSMLTESSQRLLVFISIGPSGLQLKYPLSSRMNQPACAPARRSGGVATAGRQIKGDSLKALKSFPELHQKLKVQATDLSRYRYLYRTEKPADCRLNRKTTESRYLLEYLVCAKYLHLVWPTITQEHPIKTAHKKATYTVLALSTTFYFDIPMEHLLDFMALQKSPDQTDTTKTGQVATSELFLYPDHLAFTFSILLRYALIHLLSASFVVLLVFWMPIYYYIWRHFCLENYFVNA